MLGVGDFSTFGGADSPQPQRSAMSMRKTRNQPFIYLFTIAYIITKKSSKKQAIDNCGDLLANSSNSKD